MFWELPEVSLFGTILVFCSNAESRFGCTIFRRLGLVLWLFTSCVWDVLWYRILIKTAFDLFGNVVFVVLYCIDLFSWFSYKPSEKWWTISPKGKHQLSKMTLSTIQKCLFELCFAFFFGCNWKIYFQNFLRSLYLELYVSFVQMQSHLSAALVFECYVRKFRSLHLASEMSVLGHRILIKTAFVSWAKQKLSKTTLSPFQKCLFELWWACCFGCN